MTDAAVRPDLALSLLDGVEDVDQESDESLDAVDEDVRIDAVVALGQRDAGHGGKQYGPGNGRSRARDGVWTS
jgi:hypothetical protein